MGFEKVRVLLKVVLLSISIVVIRTQNIKTFFFIWVCQVLAVACGIQFPNQGTNSDPLLWECRVLATEPQEKSQNPGQSDSVNAFVSWSISGKEGREYLCDTRGRWNNNNSIKSGVCVCVCVCVCQLLSRVRLFATPWIVACQTPLSIGLSRQEYLSEQPHPSPRDFPDPGIKRGSPALQADCLLFEPLRKPI